MYLISPVCGPWPAPLMKQLRMPQNFHRKEQVGAFLPLLPENGMCLGMGFMDRLSL